MSPSPGSPTLALYPTELEARRVRDLGGLRGGLALEAICGFGPVAAAARTAHLLATLRPARVVLIGIAGTYDAARAPVGAALEFGAVAIDGVGVGEAEGFLAPPKLGFPQWPGVEPELGRAIFDRIELEGAPADAPMLLTTCAASADETQAARRRERFPSALAEDMEGFAVALACALERVPLRIVRGISNVVGDRESTRWRIPAALAAARELAIRLLESGESPRR